MSRKLVTPANYEHVEELFIASQPVPDRARRIVGVINRLVKPDIYLHPGTGEALIAGAARNDLTNVLAQDHQSDADSSNMAAALEQLGIHEQNADNTAIPAKSDLFNLKWPIGPMMRWAIASVDAYPVFGKRDWERPENAQLTDEQREKVRQSTRRTQQAKMSTRNLFALNPEATRGRDPLTVQPLREGVAESILEVAEHRDLDVYYWGTYYGDGVNPRKPSMAWTSSIMVIGGPIPELPSSAAELTSQLHDGLQLCRDQAIDIWHQADTARIQGLVPLRMIVAA